jgi:hypothetical protein
MPLERILPEALRDRFSRLGPTGHTVGRCTGEVVVFHGMPPARCVAIVSADTGFVDEVDNPNFGSGRLRIYYCPACVRRRQGGA